MQQSRSINAQAGQIGQTNYSAAKVGIIGFTKALARESASKNITVNCIAPGYIKTSMVEKIPANVLGSVDKNFNVTILKFQRNLEKLRKCLEPYQI